MAIDLRDMLKECYPGRIESISMASLPDGMLHASTYLRADMDPGLMRLQDEILIPSEKFIWILPEYNGSFPGIVKVFIDALSVRNAQETFAFKKSLLVGLTTGRSGNIRGMDHFSDILHHMKSVIYPTRFPVSQIAEMINGSGRLADGPIRDRLAATICEFVRF